MDQYIQQLRTIPEFKVIVPLQEMTKGRRPRPVIVETAYPTDDDLTYDFDEAVDVLRIFTKVWIENGRAPDEQMLPRARSVNSGVSFTLVDIEPGLFDPEESDMDDGEW